MEKERGGAEEHEEEEELTTSSPSESIADSAGSAATFETKEEEEEETDDEFEFTFVHDDQEAAIADELFLDGKIRTVYPLFDKDLFRLYQIDSGGSGGGRYTTAARAIKAKEEEKTAMRIPLRKLMIEDESDGDRSSRSSERDELRGVPMGSYCLWTPGTTPPASPAMRAKSKSTGSSSLRWKLRDLVIGRSNSDGKKKFVLLAPTAGKEVKLEQKKKDTSTAAKQRARYRKREVAGSGERRQSYLPYRTDLVGLFPATSRGGGGSR